MSQAGLPSEFSMNCERAVNSLAEEDKKKGTWVRFASGMTVVCFLGKKGNHPCDLPRKVLEYANSPEK